jgi:hypothetical protein
MLIFFVVQISHVAGQDIIRLLWDLKVHYRFHKILPQDLYPKPTECSPHSFAYMNPLEVRLMENHSTEHTTYSIVQIELKQVYITQTLITQKWHLKPVQLITRYCQITKALDVVMQMCKYYLCMARFNDLLTPFLK